jgi:hypothetical protein
MDERSRPVDASGHKSVSLRYSLKDDLDCGCIRKDAKRLESARRDWDTLIVVHVEAVPTSLARGRVVRRSVNKITHNG